MRITAVSGSLRKDSSNTKLLQAAAALAPEGMELQLFEGIGELPHFNPDLDGDEPPASVIEWRKSLQEADGVILCTPEYANGVPGVLKNALDWIVSSGEFLDKPTAIISASPLATGGKVDRLIGQRGQLRQPSADIASFRVMRLRLRHRIHYTEVGSRFEAERGASKPTSAIQCIIIVGQLITEILLSVSKGAE